MPYLPQCATPAQREAFSLRLYRQLLSQDSRASLMSLREAFARAGGFADAHVAEASIRQDSVWINPLSAIGAKPSRARAAYRFLEIHPTNLFTWAKTAWRKQPHMLAIQPFTPELTQALLANLWGYGSWQEVMTFERHSEKRNGAGKNPNFVRGESLKNLHENVVAGKGNFRGLHIALGKTPEGEWIGLDMPRALTHTLIIDEDRTRRYGAINQWVTHRINSQDGIFLVDGSEDGSLSKNAQEAAKAAGRNIIFCDLTVDKPLISWMGLYSASSLTDLLISILVNDDDNDDVRSRVYNWCSLVALRTVAAWRCGDPIWARAIVQALETTPANSWWNADVGLKDEPSHAELWQIHERLPNDWNIRMNDVRRLLGSQVLCNTDFNPENYRKSVMVFRVPFMIGMDKRNPRRKNMLLATNLFKAMAAEGLGSPLMEESYERIIKENPNPMDRIPLFNVHVDIPMNFYSRGEAVIPSQARSLGACVVRVGPSSIIRTHSNEAIAIAANMNTKIFHGDCWNNVFMRGLPLLPNVGPDKGIAICGDEVHVFMPDYTA